MPAEPENSDSSSEEEEKVLPKPMFRFMPTRREMTFLIENAVKATNAGAKKAKKKR